MSGYRRVNYYELCRLCTNSEGTKMNIFLEEGRRRQLQTKIQTYLPIQVLEEDSLPKIVCVECIRKLETFIEFREAVVNAEGMLESYFTSLRFSEDFLKEGKVYVKSTKEEKPAIPEEPCAEEDPLTSVEKIIPTTTTAQIITDQPQSHPQQVLVSNINASNLQIISGVQARVQQYKCAMQMQSGNVAAAVVEATAETHYSYQQQTSQQMTPQQNQTQNQIVEQQSQPQSTQIQVQNQIQSQNQISQQQVQTLRQMTQQPSNQASQVNQQQQSHVNQQQSHVPQQQQSHVNQQQQPHVSQQQQPHVNQQQQPLVSQQQQPHVNQQQQPHVNQQPPHVSQQQQTHVNQQQQSHVNPQQSHVNPQQPHVNPQQPHVNPQQPLVNPQQPHVNPQQQPHVNPQQPHVNQQQQIHVKQEQSNQSQISQQLQQLQRQQREQFEKQRQMHHIEKQQQQEVHRSNIILKTEEVNEQQNLQVDPQKNDGVVQVNQQNQQTFTTVQATPEVFLSLGFKDAMNAQVNRDETKELKDFVKSPEDPLSRTSISHISEFLRLRTGPDQQAPLVTVNPQAISQAPQRQYACRECGKTFNSMNQMNGHDCTTTLLNEVTEMSSGGNSKEESPTQMNGATAGSPFSCDVCNKPFKRKEHLFQHRKLHTGERPYVCTTCAKAFSRKEHLVRHLVSHTGQKMHECEVCGKSFSRKDNLHKHRKTHGMSGPYVCETCGKSFVVKHYYLMHLTTHAPAVVDGLSCIQDPLPYKCDICDKAFTVKQYLTTHKLRHRSKSNGTAQSHNNNAMNGQQQHQQQQQQQQVQQTNSGNELTVTRDITSASMSNGTGHNANNSVIEIQGVVDRTEQQQQQQQQHQQQGDAFSSSHYQGNVAQFQ